MYSQCINFSEVPEWNTYYPSIQDATTKQKEFYRYWYTCFGEGDYIDVNGNLSYLFVYLYSVIKRFIKDKDINSLLMCFEKLKKGYGKYEQITTYINQWTSDAYLCIGNYDKAWESKRMQRFKHEIEDVINIKSKCKNTSIDGQDLILILRGNSGLTKFGKTYQEQIVHLANIFLEDFHKKHGKNMIEYFCGQYVFSNLTEDDFSRPKTSEVLKTLPVTINLIHF